MMLKLKLQYCGHLMRRVDSLEKTLWCWKGLGAEGEGDDRGWDGWMSSLTQWTWVWVNSGSWWWTGRPGVLLFVGSQRVGHDWATELNWTIFIKNLPAMQEIQVWSLGEKHCLEEEMATHSGILAWRIPWTEEPGGLQSRGLQRVGHGWAANTFTSTLY